MPRRGASAATACRLRSQGRREVRISSNGSWVPVSVLRRTSFAIFGRSKRWRIFSYKGLVSKNFIFAQIFPVRVISKFGPRQLRGISRVSFFRAFVQFCKVLLHYPAFKKKRAGVMGIFQLISSPVLPPSVIAVPCCVPCRTDCNTETMMSRDPPQCLCS